MKEISVFREKLHEHLQWNRARLLFVSMFLIALMRVKTVNLDEIATGFRGEAKVESHYKRLQRFFREFEVDYESIALMVVKVMKIPEPWVISIDRTDWRFGKTVFNVLTLGVVHHGIAFPLVWMMLDKKVTRTPVNVVNCVIDFWRYLETAKSTFDRRPRICGGRMV